MHHFSLVERNRIFLIASLSKILEKESCNFRRQHKEVMRDILDLLIVELLFENLSFHHLFGHLNVIVGIELFSVLPLTIIDDLLRSQHPLIRSNKVTKTDSSFHSNETSSQHLQV